MNADPPVHLLGNKEPLPRERVHAALLLCFVFSKYIKSGLKMEFSHTF